MASSPQEKPTARKPRVDAQRNRERILEVAREVFTESGAEGTLDQIARRAEIGPGTLYRHFPTRDALVEEVYRSEVEKLTAAGQRYSRTLPPLEALRRWMLLFVDHVARKWLILPVMESVPGGATRLLEGARGAIHGTFHELAHNAAAHGDLRAGVEPDDLLRALIGVFHTAAIPGWEASARRIIDILLEGCRQRDPADGRKAAAPPKSGKRALTRAQGG